MVAGVVCAGSVEAEEEIGKQLIVIRRRACTVRRLTEATNVNTTRSQKTQEQPPQNLSQLLHLRPLSLLCELSSHSMRYAVDVRRMQDLLMILGAPHAVSYSPPPQTYDSAAAVWLHQLQPLQARTCAHKTGSHVIKIHTCRLP